MSRISSSEQSILVEEADFTASSPVRHCFTLPSGEHYLDSAASTLLPESVIAATADYYRHEHSNIHRGVHRRSQKASQRYEHVREQVAVFIKAPSAEQVIFTHNTTDSINQVASGFLEPRLQAGDTVITTTLEHHSNWLPWQQLCQRKNAEFVSLPLNNQYQPDLDQLEHQLQRGRCKLLAVAHVSNLLGTVTQLQAIIDTAHRYDVPVLVDGAQAVGHLPVNVTQLGCDFYAFSAHKMYGPTGVGVLWIHPKHLSDFKGRSGGGTVKTIRDGKPVWQDNSQRLEAGTPNIAGVIGLGAALEFIASNPSITGSREQQLTAYAWRQLQQIDDIHLLGSQAGLSTLAFVHRQIHSHDMGSLLDERGIAVRIGHHCAAPLLESLNVKSAVRCSFGAYSDNSDIDALVTALKDINRVLSR